LEEGAMTKKTIDNSKTKARGVYFSNRKNIQDTTTKNRTTN
jgi:hypothetical protein